MHHTTLRPGLPHPTPPQPHLTRPRLISPNLTPQVRSHLPPPHHSSPPLLAAPRLISPGHAPDTHRTPLQRRAPSRLYCGRSAAGTRLHGEGRRQAGGHSRTRASFAPARPPARSPSCLFAQSPLAVKDGLRKVLYLVGRGCAPPAPAHQPCPSTARHPLPTHLC